MDLDPGPTEDLLKALRRRFDHISLPPSSTWVGTRRGLHDPLLRSPLRDAGAREATGRRDLTTSWTNRRGPSRWGLERPEESLEVSSRPTTMRSEIVPPDVLKRVCVADLVSRSTGLSRACGRRSTLTSENSTMAAGIAITYRLLESAYRCETHTDEQALVPDGWWQAFKDCCFPSWWPCRLASARSRR